ncbi:MAG: HIT family protein [Dysgonamonadaceae bacterium]|jgi:histidine triad (HIT) family protein|nr:HIT family protein [Dysgonamonadaceae bacterium]
MTVFGKIAAGEIPGYKIAENAGFYAFLDINPLVKGHTLVIPKKEVDYIYDLDDRTVGEMFIFSKQVAKAIQKAIPCKRIGIAVIGLEVPHAHIHLIPLNRESDMAFSNPRLKLTPEEFRNIAAAIVNELTS